MQIAFLGVVFLVIIGLLTLKRPLYQAIIGGLIATAMLYRIPPFEALRLVLSVFTKWSSLSVLVAFYLIIFLQRILTSRRQIMLAQQDLDGIFHNRRINLVGSAVFIGLLPSAAAMGLCSEIVKDASDGYLDRKEQAFVTSWFRHIPESTLPTYSSVLLMLNLSGVKIAEFVPGMIIPVLTLALLGYVRYLRRIPTDPGTLRTGRRRDHVKHLFQHLWSLILVLVLILGLDFSVVNAVLISILASIFIYRVRAEELNVFLRSAFEKKILSNTFVVLVLKEFITYTGVLKMLPDAVAALPLPTYLVFAILFFAATVISGSSGAIAMATPLAFAALPGGMPLMVYLMCIVHAASQISPTHVCLVAAADYFEVSLGDIIRKTLPISLMFCVLMTVYYRMLVMVF